MRTYQSSGRSRLIYINNEPYVLEDKTKEGVAYVYLDGKQIESCQDYAELREVYAQYGVSI